MPQTPTPPLCRSSQSSVSHPYLLCPSSQSSLPIKPSFTETTLPRKPLFCSSLATDTHTIRIPKVYGYGELDGPGMKPSAFIVMEALNIRGRYVGFAVELLCSLHGNLQQGSSSNITVLALKRVLLACTPPCEHKCSARTLCSATELSH